MHKLFSMLVAVGMTLTAATAARADAVGPPPPGCPAGAYPESNHCGPYCAPRYCADDDECGEGMFCQELELCIEELNCEHSGGPFTADAVHESCAGGGDCSAGSCESVLVCAHPDPVGVPRQAGCGCRAGGRRSFARKTRTSHASG